MFWSRGHALIETTEALERLLVDSDLGEDLPVELFRPPFPACFIRFGPAFQAALTPTDGRSTSAPTTCRVSMSSSRCARSSAP